MKSRINLSLAWCAAVALLMAFSVTTIHADNSAPIELQFEKSLLMPGPAPYVATFLGSVSGEINGCLVTRVTRREAVRDGKVELEAEYLIYDGDCGEGAEPLSVLVVSGKASQNHYVLNGEIVEGWLRGAQVHLEFDVVQCEPGKARCFAGTIRIMPGSAE